MSSKHFRIDEHKIEASHIRGFPRSTSTKQEEVLQLAVKQYTPLNNTSPKPGDITIIAAHANGFPKELYEPLWDELLGRCQQHGFGIRGIWIADVVHQGLSSVLNEDKLGNDPSWLDHSRDLLHMVNIFRDQMPRPIIGVGHSMGGCQLANLALLHPRLLETLILIDPVIQGKVSLNGNVGPAAASSRRRERWPSREEAAKSFGKSKFYQTWDPRVLGLWVQYGLRDVPTKLFPDAKKPEVTLMTTKHQEVMTFLRPNFTARPGDKEPSSAEFTFNNPKLNRRTHADITPTHEPQTPFYRGESTIVFNQLPSIRPSVFYIFGEHSFLTDDAVIEDKMRLTGSGVGGSGGRAEGRVANVTVRDAGHLIPMEKVEESADHISKWVGQEMKRYWDWERKTEEEWDGKQGVERSVLPERFVEELNALIKPREKKSSKL
ncbi:Alpha/beta hydrolase family-domain-containing protein [Alternaria rosae]|uniref:Alpha/beta hydrolase family-domain-containing protein n=1 Tax=Alternaria rosae TaxID=1187941 RepID=UPI001E8D990B|nr:Alpha/beta hydrolase family-domain-containing protein [Alternaria rosae]KAH6860903.1 Alpha/beta hydrolase family-domain-containing protein [Alternaria rosae]